MHATLLKVLFIYLFIVLIDKCASDSLIRVKFSGVAITVPNKCHDWLHTNLLNRPIRFQLLHRTSTTGGDDVVECVVHSRKVCYIINHC